MTPNKQDTSLTHVVAKELEEVFARCKNYGHSPEAVRAELRQSLQVIALPTPARFPGYSRSSPKCPGLLQRVLDCSRKSDATGKQLAILTWLREAHGIGLGDTIEIRGWAHRHEVLIQKVDITWKDLDGEALPDVLTDGFIWFEGPTCRETIGSSIRQSGAPLHFELVKVEPTPEFSRAFPADAVRQL